MSFQSYYKDLENYTYNPEKAKELLAEAGYPDGVEVELYYGTYGVMQQVCEMVQAQAKDAGFDIKLVGQDGAAIKSTWAVDNDDAPAGMRLQNNGTPKVTASISMDYIFGDTALQNCSKWHNSEFQALLDSLSGTFDTEEQASILGQMQELIYEDTPSAPSSTPRTTRPTATTLTASTGTATPPATIPPLGSASERFPLPVI